MTPPPYESSVFLRMCNTSYLSTKHSCNQAKLFKNNLEIINDIIPEDMYYHSYMYSCLPFLKPLTLFKYINI